MPESLTSGDRFVGLLSDTHGWLDPALLEHFRGAELIVHAGDIGSHAVLDALRAVAPVVAVRGNIDGGVLLDLPTTNVAEVAGRRLAVTHMAGSPLRPNDAVRALLARDRPDVIVVGHSHIMVAARVDGALWINPGASGNEGFHEHRTACLLAFSSTGELRLLKVDLGPRGHQSRAQVPGTWPSG
jgi:uncharacterized protein